MDYDVLAFIGRFQLFHNGHKEVVDNALSRTKKVALVLGSHDQPRSTHNPFTTAERIEMITDVFPDEVAKGRIVFVPQVDWTYSLDRWRTEIRAKVTQVANTPYTPDPVRIGLIGHSKDHTSFYLKSFPEWGHIEVDNVSGIDATSIREELFHRAIPFNQDKMPIPPQVADWITAWVATNHGAYLTMVDELDFIQNYRKQFDVLPYPPTFNTVDAVVVQSGHVLLVRRGAAPGRGLWAIPGGFLDQKEVRFEGALRELREETRIDVPEKVIRGSFVREQTFDDPNRSQRGRTITAAFLFRLEDRENLPKIKGSDDADKAAWVPLNELKRNLMFEDHYDILVEMVGL